ncbi:hypothetical protein A3D77_01705 [Candidatus Gottesmanbacteria bacterium RIFCSPHIGHO2_02_FULL_39_11]|uniref:Uncharacterized protein n=1 Tax=Candidatus Gottesmanbacteria bacterium RIFCSPHIGHO2_02_FULL_39_11 TaxID=1798382 RepID=A0A1F5ZUC2_9BACT|nr:MAG: hypothetical protein A3D77_01705 [Candidatus Gottesmanbacteria bacterium RIFCSPHIGHO2_02_FULL_39_11]
MRQKWSDVTKNRARFLREKEGYSYGQIIKELHVARSTLHLWLRNSQRPEKFKIKDRIAWLKTIQPLGAQANREKREQRIVKLTKEIQKEINLFQTNKSINRAFLSLLYWAEGSKYRHDGMIFANTDPRLVLLFITMLRASYELDERKFRIRLHLHDYHNEKQVKAFWSTLLKIPESQFTKTYRKQRSKEKTFRKNFGGICFLKYNSIDLKDRLIQHAFSLGEKITGKITVPVA